MQGTVSRFFSSPPCTILTISTLLMPHFTQHRHIRNIEINPQFITLLDMFIEQALNDNYS